MKKKNKLIGYITTLKEYVKPQYLGKNKSQWVICEIREHKIWGAVCYVYRENPASMIQKHLTKKASKEISKNLKKISKNNKPIDTSKWVKPDEESIKHHMVTKMFESELYNEEAQDRSREAKAIANVCYSILHSHSPKNPQGLTNYGYDASLITIQKEMNGKLKNQRMKISFPNYGKGRKSKKWFSGHRDLKVSRKMYKDLIKKCEKNMIKLM